jgi:hypothetical protein
MTDGTQAIQSSIDIVRYADDHKTRDAAFLFGGGQDLPLQSAVFRWYREHLNVTPLDAQKALPGVAFAGLQFPSPFDFNEFCSKIAAGGDPRAWPDTVVSQLPLPVAAAVDAVKEGVHPARLPPQGAPAIAGSAATVTASTEGRPTPTAGGAAPSGKLTFLEQPDAKARLQHVHDRVGPLTRRVAYHFITRDTALFQRLGEASIPGMQSCLAFGPLWPIFIGGIQSLGLSRAAADKGIIHLREEFRCVSAALEAAEEQGCVFLSGGCFGAVDLYWASLVAPVLLVQAYEGMHAQYPWSGADEEMKALALELRATKAGRHALACFALYRTTYADLPREQLLLALQQQHKPSSAKL